MYTLRKVSKELGTSNESLGNYYTSINRFENPDRFRELFKKVYGRNHVADMDDKADEYTIGIIGFIMTSNDNIIPIHEGAAHYVVTESGATFERVNRVMIRSGVIKNKI